MREAACASRKKEMPSVYGSYIPGMFGDDKGETAVAWWFPPPSGGSEGLDDLFRILEAGAPLEAPPVPPSVGGGTLEWIWE